MVVHVGVHVTMPPKTTHVEAFLTNQAGITTNENHNKRKEQQQQQQQRHVRRPPRKRQCLFEYFVRAKRRRCTNFPRLPGLFFACRWHK